MRVAQFLAIFLVLVSMNLQAQSQQPSYDVAVTDVWAEPLSGLSCHSKVCVTVVFAGYSDFEIVSGQLHVDLEVQIGSSTNWVAIGSIPIEWAHGANGPWYGYWTGCIDYSAMSDEARTFRATVTYDKDQLPSNNSKQSTLYQVEEACWFPFPCKVSAVKGKGISVFCPNDNQVGPIPDCSVTPFASGCRKCTPRTGFNCPAVDLCSLPGAHCPLSGAIDVFTSAGLQFAVVDAAGRIIGRGEPLSVPVKGEKGTYTQHAKFEAVQTQHYGIVVYPLGDKPLSGTVSVDALVRQGK